jgi:hypothetical protein
MIEALYLPALLLARAIFGVALALAQILRALGLAPRVKSRSGSSTSPRSPSHWRLAP